MKLVAELTKARQEALAKAEVGYFDPEEVVQTLRKPDSKFQDHPSNEHTPGVDISSASLGQNLSVANGVAIVAKLDGIHAEVIHSATIKSLDVETIAASARKTRLVVTVEEHSIIGGLHGAVAEGLSKVEPTKIVAVGTNDRFGFSGKMDELMDLLGLRSTDIVSAVKGSLAHQSQRT